MKILLWLLVVVILVGITLRNPSNGQSGQLYLTWSNELTWQKNIVLYKLNLDDTNELWKVYTFVTNENINVPKIKLDSTNERCYFRVGNLP